MTEIRLLPIVGLPLVGPGDDVAALIAAGVQRQHGGLARGDVVVVCQKIVSKAEGRIVRFTEVTPSVFAAAVGAAHGKDPRIVEIVLRETSRIVKMGRGHLIAETGPGWVCANAGVDESNSPAADAVVLLPADPDASARRLREALIHATGAEVAVLVSDTFGRPWREGLVEVALGAAGIAPLLDLRGERDLNGRELHHTVVAQADELAAAAGLLMRKGSGIPVVIVRGHVFTADGRGAAALIRSRDTDLFR